MRFELTQRYDAPATDVSDAYADVDLYPSFVGLPKLGGIEVLTHDDVDHEVRHRVRYRFTGDLPAAAAAIVDPDRLTWVQETVQDVAAGTARFRLVPDHYPDRLQAQGRYLITPDHDGSGSTRTVTGELKVRAPLVGGKVEQAIVSGLAEYLAAEAHAVDRWLRS